MTDISLLDMWYELYARRDDVDHSCELESLCLGHIARRVLPGLAELRCSATLLSQPRRQHARLLSKVRRVWFRVKQTLIAVVIISNRGQLDRHGKTIVRQPLDQIFRYCVRFRRRWTVVYLGNQQKCPVPLQHPHYLEQGSVDIIHMVEGVEGGHKVEVFIGKRYFLRGRANITHLMSVDTQLSISIDQRVQPNPFFRVVGPLQAPPRATADVEHRFRGILFLINAEVRRVEVLKMGITQHTGAFLVPCRPVC